MNTYEREVVVNDKDGIKFLCTMESEENDILGTGSLPSFLDQLSEHERRSCIRFFPESYYGLSNYEE